MSKKNKTPLTKIPAPKVLASAFPDYPIRTLLLAIGGIAFLLYFNTLFNEYALDDPIVITKNEFTLKGFAGIPDIFKHDAFDALQGTAGELTGGRYRPLSIVTFAMEVGLFGKDHPMISHLVNILIYCLECMLLLFFLNRFIFPKQKILSFFTALIFTIHPLHTEVIANIKSRDELMSLLFVLVSLILYFDYVERKKKIGILFLSLLSFFLALLSKENGMTFIAIVPLIHYFFMNRNTKESLFSSAPFVVVTALYFLLRYKIIGLTLSQSKEVMNAPFLFASATEKFATKTMILGKYLWILVFPHPLSYDYSYKQIPYVDVSDLSFMAAFAVNAFLLFYAVLKFKEKSKLSFAIFFYFITLSVVSNFVFDVGSPMNERFLFQSSIGFAIAIALMFHWIAGKESFGSVQKRKYIVSGLSITIFLLCTFKTISRNADWKNDNVLFIKDAENAPGSAKTNGHCGVTYINLALAEKDSIKKMMLLDKSIEKLNRAVMIYPNYADPYINMGVAYGEHGMLDEARQSLEKAKQLFPSSSILKTNLIYIAAKYDEKGEKLFYTKNTMEAINQTLRSVELNPNSVKAWYDLGGYYLTLQNVTKAKEAWSNALTLDPTNKEIKSWLDTISKPPTHLH